MMLKEIVPVLRIFDVNKAKEFYLDYLEFKLDWEHRFDPKSPLYMQLSKHDIKIHLSEHYGDCSPGAALRIKVIGIEEIHKNLIGKQHNYSKPGLESTPWKSEECCLIDPSGNRIIYFEEQNP